MKNTGPKWKRARRLDYSLLGTGEEFNSFTLKGHKPRNYAPGQHGADRKKKSEYGRQLTEKQKLRDTYGVSEKQFQRLFLKARSMKGVTGVNFMTILESRLDNLVFRMGFAATRRQARQLVNHGHFLVNGKKVDIPSYLCSVNDVITLKEKSADLAVVKAALELNSIVVPFVEVDKEKKTGKFVRLPSREEINKDIDEALIVEFYNRKI